MLRSFLAAALCAAPFAAQSSVTYAVGPKVAPVGCAFTLSFSNHTGAFLVTNLCPYQVFDSSGALVYTPECELIGILVGPGGTFTAEWDQTDGHGLAFPPGGYRIDFHVPELGTISTDVEIQPAADAALSTLGALQVGTTRDLKLCAPQHPDHAYFVMAAGINTGGIPTCGGTIPLDFDAIFQIALNPANGVFLNTFGLLDGEGESTEPKVAVPDVPALAGLDVILAFVALDFAEPCWFQAISEPTSVTVQ